MDWVEALNRALDYIEENLAGELTCSAIAESAYVSSSHLQRGFYSLTGFTLGEYARNRRLTLAGHELSATGAKIIDTALKYGYETPESFSKAFSRFHGVAPSLAKRNGVGLKSFDRLTVKIIMEGGSVMDYRIEKRDAFEVVVRAKEFSESNSVLIEGNVNEVPAFWDEYFAEGQAGKVSPVLGVCGELDAETKTFRYGIGDFKESAGDAPEGFETWRIPAHTWAVFKCVGALPDSIKTIWNRIYGEWLPQSKYEFMQSYDFELYTEGDTNSPDYVCEIWVPVREKQ